MGPFQWPSHLAPEALSLVEETDSTGSSHCVDPCWNGEVQSCGIPRKHFFQFGGSQRIKNLPGLKGKIMSGGQVRLWEGERREPSESIWGVERQTFRSRYGEEEAESREI